MIGKWSEMSNTEIRMKMESMAMEYDAIKNQISKLLDKLDNLDNEYIKGYKELEKRSKK